MTAPPLQPGPGPGRPEIVTAALAVAEEAAGKAYKWGGHTTAGFDCSGYVIYTLRQAFPTGGWTFMTAGSIMASGRFERVTDPQPGDIIAFPRGGGSVDHVGIVVSATHWIGSQSSTGVAQVSMSNVYWSRRTHHFLRVR